MKSNLLIRTGCVNLQNMKVFPEAGWLPVFIIRSIHNSNLIGKYSNTAVHMYWLAPHPETFHLWRDGKIDWNTYSRMYENDVLKSVKFDSLIKRLEILVDTSGARGVVLMGYGEDPKLCHRSILSRLLNSSGLLEERVKELIV